MSRVSVLGSFCDQMLLHRLGKAHLIYPLTAIFLFLTHLKVITLQPASQEAPKDPKDFQRPPGPRKSLRKPRQSLNLRTYGSRAKL